MGQRCAAERRISLETQEAFLHPTVLPVGAGPFRTASASLFFVVVVLFPCSRTTVLLRLWLFASRWSGWHVDVVVNRWGSPDVGIPTVLAPRTGQGVRFLMRQGSAGAGGIY